MTSSLGVLAKGGGLGSEEGAIRVPGSTRVGRSSGVKSQSHSFLDCFLGCKYPNAPQLLQGFVPIWDLDLAFFFPSLFSRVSDCECGLWGHLLLSGGCLVLYSTHRL